MSPRYSTEQKQRIGIYIGLYLHVYICEKALEESNKLYSSKPGKQESEVVRTSVDLLRKSIDLLKSNVPSSIIAKVPVGKKISDLEALATDALLKLDQKSQ